MIVAKRIFTCGIGARAALAAMAVACIASTARAAPDPGSDEARIAPLRAGALRIYEGAAPGVAARPTPEAWEVLEPAGVIVRNVSVPTITPVLPGPRKGNGAAILVIPGGANLMLSMENEGINVARFLAEHGIAAFVLKYRTQPTPVERAGFNALVVSEMARFVRMEGRGVLPGEDASLADAQQALRVIRSRAAQWGIDPSRIGVVGFSAGGIAARNVTIADAADARPAFTGVIYGQMTPVTVPADAPPLFVALASDDPLFGRQGFALVENWRAAGKPVELHYYQSGSHGFGMNRQGTTSDGWAEAFIAWLDGLGVRGPAKTVPTQLP